MSFISNDWDSFLVDTAEEYDKRNYTVIRRLFVKPNEDNMSETYHPAFDEEFIRRNLRKYGNIEQIEMLNFGKPEAYVTFSESSSAYFAILDSKNLATINVLKIQPADTWVQPIEMPDEPMDDDDSEPAIFVLDDDCFERIFLYLDAPSSIEVANVCKRFRTIVKPFISRIRKYHLHDYYSLTVVRRHLKHVGKLIEEIVVCKRDDFSRSNRFHSIDRWFDKLVQYVGPQLKKASFIEILYAKHHIEKLVPMIKNLEELTIDDLECNVLSKVDLTELCPNLTKLKVSNWPFSKGKPFPSLQSFEYGGCDNFATDNTFFKHNHQLKEIRFGELAPPDEKIIEAIVTHVPNVEKISLAILDHRYCDRLSQLTNLTSLILTCSSVNLTEVLRSLARIVNLRELKIITNDWYHWSQRKRNAVQMAFVEMAEALPHLEIFLVSELDVDANTFVEFIGKAHQLKSIYLLSIPINDSDLRNIAGVVSSRQPAKELAIYLDAETFNSLPMTNDEDMPRVSKFCSSELFFH